MNQELAIKQSYNALKEKFNNYRDQLVYGNAESELNWEEILSVDFFAKIQGPESEEKPKITIRVEDVSPSTESSTPQDKFQTL